MSKTKTVVRDTVYSVLGFAKDERYRILVVSLFVGLVIRFILMPISSSPFDVGEGWAAIIDSYYANDDLYTSGWYLYPPIWGYILSITGNFTQVIGMTSFGDVFAVYGDKFNCIGYNYITNLQFNTIVKIPGVLFDVATGWAIYKIAYRLSSDIRKSCICFALWFLCPLVIMSSSMLCMFDSIIVFLIVVSILTFLDKRYFTTGVMIALGTLTKFFPLILAPFMVAYVLSDRSETMKARIIKILYALAGFLLTFVIVYLPVLLTGEFGDSITFITMRTDEATSGFQRLPTFNNIVHYLPLIAVEYLVMFAYMLFTKKDRDKVFLWMMVLIFVPIFALPGVSYTPTYGIILLPAVVILYCMKGKISAIPWLALLVFPLHGICHYWGQFFYPLGAFTNIVELSSIPEQMYNSTIYDGILWSMCLSGFAFVAVLAYYLWKRSIMEVNIVVQD